MYDMTLESGVAEHRYFTYKVDIIDAINLTHKNG